MLWLFTNLWSKVWASIQGKHDKNHVWDKKTFLSLIVILKNAFVISNSSKYALKAVLYLAVHSAEEKKILAKNLSDATNVPRAYLSKLLQELVRHNLISSTRGPRGGFYLTNENRKVFLINIIKVIDGDTRLTSCVLSLNKCDANNPCPMHHLMGNAKIDFVKNLEETTVQDLVFDIQEGRSFLPL